MNFSIFAVILSPLSHKFLPTDIFRASSNNYNINYYGLLLFGHEINQKSPHFHHPIRFFPLLLSSFLRFFYIPILFKCQQRIMKIVL